MKQNDAPYLLDATRLVWRRWKGLRPTGIDRICSAWLEHYHERSQAVIVHRRGQAILPINTSQALFRLLLAPLQPTGDAFRFRAALVGLALRRGAHIRDRLQGNGRLWLNAGHTGLDSPHIGDWALRRDVRPVYLVHDLIPISHPQYCRAGENERHKKRMRTVLETAAGVVANSAHTLDCLQDFAMAEGHALPSAVVAWPGTPILPPIPPANGAPPTFVVLGTIEGRKNHKLLLSVWERLVDRLGPAAPTLLIVGRRGWQAQDVFDILDRQDFQGKVIELGSLDDQQLTEALVNAKALLFPSFAEGFGIPLVEALELGIPVIASDLPVFREIGQGIPELLPPTDLAAWTDAVLQYAEPASQRRTDQIVRLGRFQKVTWDDHFETLDAFLGRLGNRGALS